MPQSTNNKVSNDIKNTKKEINKIQLSQVKNLDILMRLNNKYGERDISDYNDSYQVNKRDIKKLIKTNCINGDIIKFNKNHENSL